MEGAVGKIYSAIPSVMNDMGVVSKDKVNKQQGFKFRSIDDVYNALHPALAKNKVFIVPEILSQSREMKTTRSGTEMVHVICNIKFVFFAEDGSSIETIIIGEAQDTGDKATNKAMAIAYKYACFQVFCIPTEEMKDPDEECLELDGVDNGKPKGAKGQKKNDRPCAKADGKSGKAEDAPVKSGQENQNKENPENAPVTEAMIATIREQQKLKGVTDKQILAMKSVKAKRIEDMTVGEFKAVMNKFEKTPPLPGAGAST